MAGNLLRGVGEAPIMPLGMSYIDDFATEENSAFYIGKIKQFFLPVHQSVWSVPEN